MTHQWRNGASMTQRHAVNIMLADEEWAQWSDREIARRCAVSQPFVSGLRPKHVGPSDNDYKMAGDELEPIAPQIGDIEAAPEKPAKRKATRKGMKGAPERDRKESIPLPGGDLGEVALEPGDHIRRRGAKGGNLGVAKF